MNDRHGVVLDANHERIETSYLEAIRRGYDRPVMLIFDLKDTVTAEIAGDLVGSDAVAKAVVGAERDDVEAGYVWTLPHDSAIERLGRVDALVAHDVGGFASLGLLPIVIVTAGGIVKIAGIPKPEIDPT
jgi:hypothetical protein